MGEKKVWVVLAIEFHAALLCLSAEQSHSKLVSSLNYNLKQWLYLHILIHRPGAYLLRDS